MNKIKIDHYYKNESKTLRLDDVDYNIIPNSGIKPLLDKLQQENQHLKQWDINKDTRNSRQRVANKNLSRAFQKLKKDNNVITNNNIKLLKENKQLKNNWKFLKEYVDSLWLDDKGIVTRLRERINLIESDRNK